MAMPLEDNNSCALGWVPSVPRYQSFSALGIYCADRVTGHRPSRLHDNTFLFKDFHYCQTVYGVSTHEKTTKIEQESVKKCPFCCENHVILVSWRDLGIIKGRVLAIPSGIGELFLYDLKYSMDLNRIQSGRSIQIYYDCPVTRSVLRVA